MAASDHIRPLKECDCLWLKDFDCSPLPRERDSIYMLFCIHFRETCFVAERSDEGIPIGYVLAMPSADGSSVQVHALFVRAANRDSGTGRALVESVVAAAAACGARRVVLYTVRSEPFYARLGFERGWPGLGERLRTHIVTTHDAVPMYREIVTTA